MSRLLWAWRWQFLILTMYHTHPCYDIGLPRRAKLLIWYHRRIIKMNGGELQYHRTSLFFPHDDSYNILFCIVDNGFGLYDRPPDGAVANNFQPKYFWKSKMHICHSNCSPTENRITPLQRARDKCNKQRFSVVILYDTLVFLRWCSTWYVHCATKKTCLKVHSHDSIPYLHFGRKDWTLNYRWSLS